MQNVLKMIINLLVSFSFISCSVANKQKALNQQIDSRFYDNVRFSILDIDINQDGKMDKVIFHKFIQGDSLFVYEKTENGYLLSLRTINFSDDGMFVVDSIYSNKKDELIIDTYFNGAGGMKVIQYLKRKHFNQWILSNTYFENTVCLDEDNCNKNTQNIIQNIELNENTDWSKYLVPEY
jgi:hypothetical protein